ncbi:MAG: hypothetical protein DSZ06_00895 [Sulfurospirillum sp.]|nr:MAG: hypothetical protein DSZ06_00895 [Sulfurospirillum sp.]
MGVKSLALLGIATSSLFIYWCIETKKDQFYNSIHTDKEMVPNELIAKSEKPIPVKELKNPSFAYISDKKSKIAAILSKKDADSKIVKSINAMCDGDGCIKSIKYFDNIKEFAYASEVIELINRSIESNADHFSFSLENNMLVLSGNFEKQKDIDDILDKCKPFADGNYTLVNNLHLNNAHTKKKQKVKHIVKKEVIENKAIIKSEPKKIQKTKPTPVKAKPVKITKIKDPVTNKQEIKKVVKKVKQAPKAKVVKTKDVRVNDVFIIPKHIDSQEAGYRISDLLLVEPIEFAQDGRSISKESENTLNKIADIIKKTKNIKVDIIAYSAKQENNTYARVLSQRKADSIRRYLINKGISSSILRSIGKGASDFVADPYDEINNRIDIKIRER